MVQAGDGGEGRGPTRREDHGGEAAAGGCRPGGRPRSATDDAEIVDAIYANRLAAVAGEILTRPDATDAQRSLARRAAAACARIGSCMAAEQRRVLDLLSDGGIAAGTRGEPGPRQRHEIELRVATRADAARAADLLEAAGFWRWDDWSGGAAASFWRTAEAVTMARTEDATIAVHLRWADRGRPSRVARALRPTPADWSLMALPTLAWPAYHVIRPLRLAAERVGLRRAAGWPGPHLSTPDGLVEPLLDVAGVGPADTVLDFGCGDGRLVVAAARRGSRAIGVEAVAAVAARAHLRSAESGVGDRVHIVHGDAWRVDLREVTVVTAFLPASLTGRVLRHALPRLPSGARLLVHEQVPLPGPLRPPPDDTRALIADDSLTVAHLWRRK